MKKVIVITLLMTVIAAMFIGSVCYADESSGVYYYVKEVNSKEIPMYRNSTIEGNGVLVYIPTGYAFEYLGAADNSSYAKIRYNGIEGYLNVSDFDKNCAKVTSPAWEGKYAYTIAQPSLSSENIDIFKQEDVNQKYGSASKSTLTIDKVYGYYHKENDSAYYFLADFTVNNFGETKGRGYIKASDTSLADFSHQNIQPSAGYIAETEIKDDIPDNNNPDVSGDNDKNETKSPTNNLERYILIAVIAVLCVVIIILIFAPNKSKRSRSDL